MPKKNEKKKLNFIVIAEIIKIKSPRLLAWTLILDILSLKL